MGNLVKFDQRRRTSASRMKHSGGAQILLFTGVRYERGPVSNTQLNPTKPKRKRG